MNISRISSVSNTQYFVVRTKLLTLMSFNRFNHCYQNQINLSMYTAMKMLCNLCDVRAGRFLSITPGHRRRRIRLESPTVFFGAGAHHDLARYMC